MTERRAAYNRRLAKKRVQWLNEAVGFVSGSVLADSLVLRNPLLRQAPKRWQTYLSDRILTKNRKIETKTEKQ